MTASLRPLASPAVEYRATGIVAVLGGVALTFIAPGSESPAVSAAEALIIGAVLAAGMYLVTYRPFLDDAIVEAQVPPAAADRESVARTVRRGVLTSAALLVLMAALVATFGDPALAGGVAVGNGAAVLITSHWLARFEREHRCLILREPRWRCTRTGTSGWRRARGTMDPQDFYIVPSTGSQAD